MAYCDGCGAPLEDCDGTCRGELDPPRFCRECGRKLDVQVTPTGYRAGCRRHPPVAPTGEPKL